MSKEIVYLANTQTSNRLRLLEGIKRILKYLSRTEQHKIPFVWQRSNVKQKETKCHSFICSRCGCSQQRNTQIKILLKQRRNFAVSGDLRC